MSNPTTDIVDGRLEGQCILIEPATTTTRLPAPEIATQYDATFSPTINYRRISVDGVDYEAVLKVEHSWPIS